MRACNVVVPLILSTMYENCVRCKEVVIIDDVGEVGTCLMAFSGFGCEEIVAMTFIQGV